MSTNMLEVFSLGSALSQKLPVSAWRSALPTTKAVRREGLVGSVGHWADHDGSSKLLRIAAPDPVKGFPRTKTFWLAMIWAAICITRSIPQASPCVEFTQIQMNHPNEINQTKQSFFQIPDLISHGFSRKTMEHHFFQQHPGTTPSSPSAELNGPQGAVKKKNRKLSVPNIDSTGFCPTLIQEMLSNSIASKFKISSIDSCMEFIYVHIISLAQDQCGQFLFLGSRCIGVEPVQVGRVHVAASPRRHIPFSFHSQGEVAECAEELRVSQKCVAQRSPPPPPGPP